MRAAHRGRASTSALTLVLALVLSPGVADARLQPSPGGRVTVALPAELLDDTVRAHLYAPLLEPVEGEAWAFQLAHPPLAGLPGWRSDVLSALDEEAGGRVWRLTPQGLTAATLAVALKACFDTSLTTTAANAGASWPGLVARALDMDIDIDSDGQRVTVRFDRQVGVAPELLSGCLVMTSDGPPTGPFAQMAANLLAARPSGAGGPPLLGVMELRELGGPADIVGGSPQSGSGSALLAPFPDVVVLVQSQAARAADPFEIAADEGWTSFHRDLGADLLLAVYWAGRGRAAEDLLPPGVAPARPLAQVPLTTPSGPLALSALPAKAPRLPVHLSASDGLLAGVVERLAVLLRSGGYGVQPVPDEGGTLEDGVALVRWRPKTADPSLALLALAGQRPDVKAATPPAALADPRLLSTSMEERVAAALALERAWLDARVVVPLMTADRWFAVDPSLRGVRVRADGVPLLDDAYWGGRE